MSVSEDDLARDRSLRQRAQASFKESVAAVRGEAAAGNVAKKVARRAGEGAAGFAEDAAGLVRNHYGKIAAVAAVAAVIMTRKQLQALANEYVPGKYLPWQSDQAEQTESEQ